MEKKLLNIGFGNTVVAERIVAIVAPGSSPMKRLKDDARDYRQLVDVTQGRRTRAIIVMDSNHIVLSAIQFETIAQRFEDLMKTKTVPVAETE
jgi:extracellular matrix regulatory protein A